MFSLRLRTPMTAQATALRARTIAVSARQFRPERSEMSNQDPAVLEREKQKNLKGEQDHSPHPETAPKWNEALASESEATVKADQAQESHVDPKKLQEQTVEHTKKVHGH